MKRELFRRNTSMTHRFGSLADYDDPVLGTRNFDPNIPVFPKQSSRSLNVQRDGEYRFLDPMSPVETPSGRCASMNGPAPDSPDSIAQTIPGSTKKRKTP